MIDKDMGCCSERLPSRFNNAKMQHVLVCNTVDVTKRYLLDDL